MTNVLALPVGTELVGDFRIERVLGAGGFGITYLAEELALARLVTLKEYFPSDFAARDADDAVPRSQDREADYSWGLTRFIEEAQVLARFDHRNIVRVYRYFQANNTAYMVLQFEEGASLKGWLRQLGRAPRQAELDEIVAPLLEALEIIHAADFLHRDIAPDNIIIRKDGSPVLIDFGSARGEIARHSRTVSALVKPGYSPYEQYAETGARQGPWTDIYALGATLYHAVTGKRPPDAPSRIVKDELIPAREAALGRFRPRFLSAIDRALALEPARRPPSVAAWRGDLLAPEPSRKGWLGRAAETLRDSAKTRVLPPEEQPGAEAAVLPAPDAPGRKGGLIDYIDAVKRKAEPRLVAAEVAIEAAPPPPAPAAPAAAVAAAVIEKPPPSRARKSTPPRKSPQPQRRRRPAAQTTASTWLKKRMRPLLLKLAIGAAVASGAVILQREMSLTAVEFRGTKEVRGSTEVASAVRDPVPPLQPTHIAGHRRGTTALKFIDSGRQLVTTGADGSIRVWNAQTGAMLRTIELDNGAATAFDVVEHQALTGHANGTTDLWDIDTGERISRFKRNDAAIWAVAFAGESGLFVTSSHDWSIAQWDVRSPAAPLAVAEAHDGPVQAIAWSPRGLYVATGGADGMVKLWRAENLEQARTYRGHRDAVGALTFSPDGKLLASAGQDGSIRIWATAASRLYRVLTGHRGRITNLAFSPAGDVLASAGEDGSVRLSSVRNIRSTRAFNASNGPANAVAFSPDGARLAVAGADGAVRFWAATSSTR
jgi:serine/threonine protein kinase